MYRLCEQGNRNHMVAVMVVSDGGGGGGQRTEIDRVYY